MGNKKKFIGLLEIIRDMGCLNKKIQEIVPSIKGELEVLKKHSQSTSEDDLFDDEDKETASEEQVLLNEVEDISKSIVSLNKHVEDVSEVVNPLKEKERELFHIQVKEFQNKVDSFRMDFNKNIPNKLQEFNKDVIVKSYETLDNYKME